MRRRLAEARHRRRRPGRRPDPLRHRRALRRDPRRAGRRAPRTSRSTPTTRTSGPSWSSARPGSRAVLGDGGALTWHTAPIGTPGTPGPGRRRVDHLHLRLHRHAQGRRGQPPHRGRVRRRRGPAVPHRRARSAPATGCWPGCRSPSTPPARRCGSPGGTAPAWCPRPGRWSAAASTSGRGWSSSGITVVSTVPTLAALWPAGGAGRGPAADLRRRGLPARAGRAAGRRGPRGVEHLRPDRGDRGRLRRAADRRGPGADRAAAGRLGARRRRRARASRSRWARAASWSSAGSGLARYLDAEQGRREVRAAAVPRLGAGLPQRRPRARRARGAGLPRPGRRAGQARRAPDRAGRGRRGAAGAARRRRRGGRRAPDRGGQPAAGRLRRAATATASTPTAAALGCASSCPPRWCRCSPWSTSCRPAPPARSTGTRCPGRCPRRAAPTRRGEPRPPTEAWLAEQWAEILGVTVDRRRRRLLRRRRQQPGRGPAGHAAPRTGYPQVAVADIYQHPTLRELAGRSTRSTRPATAAAPRRPADAAARRVRPGAADGAAARAGRAALGWSSLAALGNVLAARARPGRRPPRGGGRGWAGCCCSARPGGSAIAAGGARLLLRGVRPGSYPRGGAVHLRLWAAERLAELSGATCARRRVLARPATPGRSARKIGPDVDLHSRRRSPGMLKLGRRRGGRARGRPVAATGSTATRAHRQGQGRRRRRGRHPQHAVPGRPGRQGRRDRRRARPCTGAVPAGQRWAGAPAQPGRQGAARPGRRPGRRARARWVAATASTALLLGLMPVVAALPALAVRRCALADGVASRRRRAARCSLVAPGDRGLPAPATRCSSWRRAAARHRPARRATTRCTAG